MTAFTPWCWQNVKYIKTLDNSCKPENINEVFNLNPCDTAA